MYVGVESSFFFVVICRVRTVIDLAVPPPFFALAINIHPYNTPFYIVVSKYGFVECTCAGEAYITDWKTINSPIAPSAKINLPLIGQWAYAKCDCALCHCDECTKASPSTPATSCSVQFCVGRDCRNIIIPWKSISCSLALQRVRNAVHTYK